MRFRVYTGGSGGMDHRGKLLDRAIYLVESEETSRGWQIDDIERCIGRVKGERGWFVVPSSREDEPDCLDIGPFPDLRAAAVAATLMESK